MLKLGYKDSKISKIIISIIDVLLVNLGYYLTFLIRYGFNPADRNLYAYINIIPYISIVIFIFFSIYGVSLTENHNFQDKFYSIGISLLMINIFTVAIAFFLRSFAFPRSVLIISYFMQFIILMLWKYVIFK